MFSKNFFRPMLGILAILLFTFALAHATDPVKIKTDPGKSSTKTPTTVSIAQSEELGNFVRQNALTVSLSSESNTIRYEAPVYFLNGNDLATNVTATYSLSTGNVQSLFILTKNRSGQQTFTLYPYSQENNEISGSGPATAEWMLMELNRINQLSKPNKYIQTSEQPADPQETSGILNQPEKTSKTKTNKTQR